MYNEKDLELKGFDLGEQGGGMQLIIAAKTISPTEFYVATLGNALPKIQNSPKQDLPSDEIMTDEEIEEIEFVGLVSNICVISNICVFQGAFPNAQIVVDPHLIASFDAKAHTSVLEVMRGLQVNLI